MKNGWSFGFSQVSPDFVAKINKELATYNGAAMAYLHIKQMTKTISACNKNIECIKNKMDNMGGESIIGFQGFQNRIAVFDMSFIKH